MVVEKRRAGRERRLGRGHGRQRFDVEHDGFAGIAGLDARLGDHERERIADIADPVLGQRRARRLAHRRAVAVAPDRLRTQLAIAEGLEIRRGPDSEHAGHRPRGGGIDRADPAMRVGAAQDPGMGLARQVDVVGIGAAPGQELRILAPAHRLTDRETREFEG